MEEEWKTVTYNLKPNQIFRTSEGFVMLDRRVPGDGTKWYVADWNGKSWGYYDGTIEPCELEEIIAPEDFDWIAGV